MRRSLVGFEFVFGVFGGNCLGQPQAISHETKALETNPYRYATMKFLACWTTWPAMISICVAIAGSEHLPS
ncbi:MAG: hypothetical protein JWO28_1162 [Hyphomicrobiales bacterium]|nr:hypothetical protein [Hyphomicrobiales bacterium]